MRKIEFELNRMIKIFFEITVICGLIYRFSGNEVITYITGVSSVISFIIGFIMVVLKDEIKERRLQKEGWV